MAQLVERPRQTSTALSRNPISSGANVSVEIQWQTTRRFEDDAVEAGSMYGLGRHVSIMQSQTRNTVTEVTIFYKFFYTYQ